MGSGPLISCLKPLLPGAVPCPRQRCSSKTRAYPYADVLPTVRRVYDAFGPRRLMWGTGFVHGKRVGRIPYGQELELIREHVPFFTREDQEWILGRTAQSLWRFGAN
jgi:predicted TIM-barrel fold metal-dependent hydrolase